MLLIQKFRNHLDHGRVRLHRACPGDANAQFLCQLSRFYIEVVNHLHMVGEKPDGHDRRIASALSQLSRMSGSSHG